MEEKENRFAEANDGEITRNHAMIMNGFFPSFSTTKLRCEN